MSPVLNRSRVKHLLSTARQRQLVVVGDLMLDQFIWGRVSRISPEAPVPVVEYVQESCMPGGAANVARNLAALRVPTRLFGLIGRDDAGRRLQSLLREQAVDCRGLVSQAARLTTLKTRVVAHQQQVVRVDRETRHDADPAATRRLLRRLESQIPAADAVIVGDYGKGVVTSALLDGVRRLCRARGVWLSVDPKPVHHLDLSRLSLITPNRKEAFELAGVPDGSRTMPPLQDAALLEVARQLIENLKLAILLITLGDQGMLLCQRRHKPFHIPTVAQEVFDVSGAGDTVIATFTLAIAAGASPLEAALLSNHAAGIVVGKVGTATVSPEELLRHCPPTPWHAERSRNTAAPGVDPGHAVRETGA
ncbi:MAG: D-glycero-beta-D-manno-heptose-7-phosphate kinase [Verrucomicrobia bacterium]|nr:D-glycero-beta-D-manno-heptose-7-phosphate kinase [Verrucomicrobiota bacterium]